MYFQLLSYEYLYDVFGSTISQRGATQEHKVIQEEYVYRGGERKQHDIKSNKIYNYKYYE